MNTNMLVVASGLSDHDLLDRIAALAGCDDRNRSRHTPNHSKRVAWRRDGGQCAFIAPEGHRCTERAFIEFHHVDAHALGGPSTPDNIGLRCRRHNQYEAEKVFGPRDRSGGHHV